MELSVETVRQIYQDLLNGTISRDDADRWACSVMLEMDNGTLTFLPRHDEKRIWKSVSFLCGVDLLDGPGGNFISSEDDIRERLNRLIMDN